MADRAVIPLKTLAIVTIGITSNNNRLKVTIITRIVVIIHSNIHSSSKITIFISSINNLHSKIWTIIMWILITLHLCNSNKSLGLHHNQTTNSSIHHYKIKTVILQITVNPKLIPIKISNKIRLNSNNLKSSSHNRVRN